MMKTIDETKLIGLLAGKDWRAIGIYSEILNRAAEERTKGKHSARILAYSIDYNAIENLPVEAEHQIPFILGEEIDFFLTKGPDCLIVCSIAMHETLDRAWNAKTEIPLFHAGHVAAEEAQNQGRKNVLLLGSEFTMTNGFYARYFQDRGINVVIPCPEDIVTLQNIQSNVARGNMTAAYKLATTQIIGRYSKADAVILASTELPMVIGAEDSPALPLINPVECQCREAAAFAFGGGQA